MHLLIIGTYVASGEVRKKTINRLIFWVAVCDVFSTLKFVVALVLGKGTNLVSDEVIILLEISTKDLDETYCAITGIRILIT